MGFNSAFKGLKVGGVTQSV